MPRRSIKILMIVIGLIAVGLVSAMNNWEFVAITIGPTIGAVIHRSLGGRGILGGAIGGLLYFCGFGVVVYALQSLHPQPNSVDYIGPVIIPESG